MSQYIDGLKPGEFIQVKGPKGQFEYKPNMVKEFGMIAGGAGITPMLQVCFYQISIINNRKNEKQ